MDIETPVAPAPDTAAADAGAAPITPDSPSSSALSAAFEALASGITDTMRVPEPVTPEPVADPEPAPTGEQPRDEQGRFLPKDADPAPVVDDTPAPVDTQEPPPAAEAATDVGAEEEEIDPATIVEILPRHAHEEPYRIAVDSPEVAERLRQNLNGAMRREQYEEAMREVQQRAQQVEDREVSLIVDPVRTVREVLTPEQQELLVLALMTDDTLYERLGDKLSSLHDDLSRRELRLDVRDRYSQAREQAAQTVQQQRAVQKNTREVMTALDAIAPEGITPAAREIWKKDAMRELAIVCRHHKISLLDPMAIPTALEARLVATGVDPQQATEAIARAVFGRKTPAAAPPSGGAPRTASAPALPAPPRAGTPQTGQRPVSALKVAHERRAAAAATAGPGVGTPASGGLPTLPSGAGLDEALALVRRVKS